MEKKDKKVITFDDIFRDVDKMSKIVEEMAAAAIDARKGADILCKMVEKNVTSNHLPSDADHTNWNIDKSLN